MNDNGQNPTETVAPPIEGETVSSAGEADPVIAAEVQQRQAGAQPGAEPAAEPVPVVLSRDAERLLFELHRAPDEVLSDQERAERDQLAAAKDEADRQYTHMAAAQLRFIELHAKGNAATPEEADERAKLETELNLRERADPETTIRDWVRRELHLLQQGISEVMRRAQNP